MRGYLCAISRVFKEHFIGFGCNILQLKLLMTVVDNYIKERQRNAIMSDSHSRLSLGDVKKIFEHLILYRGLDRSIETASSSQLV